ncbi:MAG: hypothetical protein H6626_02795 [Pseudobdellovibrionaceae bacterium]|nr:MAG: hypothetical protein H6626_02795 [Pseudobdellovibrionaceae bacterium]
MTKKLIATIAFLTLSYGAHAENNPENPYTDYISEQQNNEQLVLEFRDVLELMLQKGLAEKTEDGVTLSKDGKSILDQLREEGRVNEVTTMGGSICW